MSGVSSSIFIPHLPREKTFKFSFADNKWAQPRLFTVKIVKYSRTHHITETPCTLRGWHSLCLWLLRYLHVFLTVWFIVVNRDFLKTELKFINQLSIINELNFPPASILLYPLWGFGKQNKLITKDNLCLCIIEFLRHLARGDRWCRMETPVDLGKQKSTRQHTKGRKYQKN